MTVLDLLEDLPLALAVSAHAGTGHTPERRGEQERENYAAQLAADYAALAVLADTESKREQLLGAFAHYRHGYRDRSIALLRAKGSCISTMITGPARFPIERARKASARADRLHEELITYRLGQLRQIRRLLGLSDGSGPIMAGDADAVERLTNEIEAAEKRHTFMLAVNQIIRRHAKAGPEAQAAALAEGLRISPASAQQLLGPDAFGRIGFAQYQFTNNKANIHRLRARLCSVSAAKATAATEVQGEGGVRFEDAPPANHVRLYFPGRPEPEVRAALKARGFRWTPSLGCWQAYRNHATCEYARSVAGLVAPDGMPSDGDWRQKSAPEILDDLLGMLDAKLLDEASK